MDGLKAAAGTFAGGLIVLVAALVLAFLGPARAAEACGVASWYGTESCSNPRCLTANGEVFTGRDLTAAHKSLPFGTRLKVSYRDRSVTVRINDRGPFIAGRSLDLSRAAASSIGMIDAGVGRVCWRVL